METTVLPVAIPVTRLGPDVSGWVPEMNQGRRGSDNLGVEPCRGCVRCQRVSPCCTRVWNHVVQTLLSRQNHPPMQSNTHSHITTHLHTNPPFYSSNQDVRMNIRGEKSKSPLYSPSLTTHVWLQIWYICLLVLLRSAATLISQC